MTHTLCHGSHRAHLSSLPGRFETTMRTYHLTKQRVKEYRPRRREPLSISYLMRRDGAVRRRQESERVRHWSDWQPRIEMRQATH